MRGLVIAVFHSPFRSIIRFAHNLLVRQSPCKHGFALTSFDYSETQRTDFPTLRVFDWLVTKAWAMLMSEQVYVVAGVAVYT